MIENICRANATNLGYTKSANLALRAPRADWIVLLNSDTIVTTGWLRGLLRCALLDKAVAAVGPLSNSASSQSVAGKLPSSVTPEDMAAIVGTLSQRQYPRVPFLSGFCMLASIHALAEIGYLDEINFPGYGADDDMCLRLIDAGYALAIADDVYVYHAKGASFGRGDQRSRMMAEAGDKLSAMWPSYDPRSIRDAVVGVPVLRELKDKIREAVALRSPKTTRTPPYKRLLQAAGDVIGGRLGRKKWK